MMLGQLPTTLEVCGVDYRIQTDYRNILQIISALNDDELQDNEKVYICLRRLFTDFTRIPPQQYGEAYTAAAQFIECQHSDDRPGPKVVDWEKDEHLIFASINKVAGQEVRMMPYLHWWTFLGFFQSIDRDDLFGFIVSIRHKRAKGRKLEKHETEFFNANRSLCEIHAKKNRKKDAEDYLTALYKELSNGEG